MLTFKPMYDQVLVRLGSFRSNTKGGIVLPKDVVVTKFPIQFAEVVSVGAGGPLESGGRKPMDVQVGDLIAMHAQCPKIRIPETANFDGTDKSLLHIISVIHIVAIVACDSAERDLMMDPNKSDPESEQSASNPALQLAIPAPKSLRLNGLDTTNRGPVNRKRA